VTSSSKEAVRGIPFVRSSMTRIWGGRSPSFTAEREPGSRWESGDYVLAEVLANAGGQSLEVPGGRLCDLAQGDHLIGALGTRHATLELTGSWKDIGDDGLMHLLGTGGILGKLRSRSTLVPAPAELRYVGHLLDERGKLTMGRAARALRGSGASEPSASPDTWRAPGSQGNRTGANLLALPVILLTGTSMSAGKTTAGKVLARRLRSAGLGVLGVKLTGAGRYRDIVALADAGAEWILDFVDVGLPSTCCAADEYLPALEDLLGRMAGVPADVAVIEIGASPLEPYNGTLAIEAIRGRVVLHILCASDPYAVAGALAACDLHPDLVTGPASNTEAGVELVARLTGLTALDLRDPRNLPALDERLLHRVPGFCLPSGGEPGVPPAGSST